MRDLLSPTKESLMRRSVWGIVLTFGVALFLTTQTSFALVQRIYPLKDALALSDLIFVAKVETLDLDKPSAVLTISEQLKGKAGFDRLPINLKGDSEAKKLDHTPQLLKRLAPKLMIIVFATKQDKKYTAFAYSNGTWFQLVGEEADKTVRWGFTHCEPYLRRTFKGSTADLKQIVEDGLAGKKKPPEPDAKEKPGLGPEAPREKDQSRIEDRGLRIEDRGSKIEVGGRKSAPQTCKEKAPYTVYFIACSFASSILHPPSSILNSPFSSALPLSVPANLLPAYRQV
jgi:hypothetical protein